MLTLAHASFAQLVSSRENQAAGCARTIAAARAAGDEATVAALEAPDVAKRYFDSIASPDKPFLLVPRTGHDPNRAMLIAGHALIARTARLIE